MSNFKLLPLLIFVSLFIGCAPEKGLVGSGPVVLSDSQKQHYETWGEGRPDRDPLYFFLVRVEGAYSVFCPTTIGLCREATEIGWKEKCENRYGKGDCRLYASLGTVVWEFDKPADPNWAN